eukprot:1158892-Pelagomonas_calceolata.AAC.3
MRCVRIKPYPCTLDKPPCNLQFHAHSGPRLKGHPDQTWPISWCASQSAADLASIHPHQLVASLFPPSLPHTNAHTHHGLQLT